MQILLAQNASSRKVRHPNKCPIVCERNWFSLGKLGLHWLISELTKIRPNLKIVTQDLTIIRLGTSGPLHIPHSYFPFNIQHLHPQNWKQESTPALNHIVSEWNYVHEGYLAAGSNENWLLLFSRFANFHILYLSASGLYLTYNFSIGIWSFVEIEEKTVILPSSKLSDWQSGTYQPTGK